MHAFLQPVFDSAVERIDVLNVVRAELVRAARYAQHYRRIFAVWP